MQGQQKLRCDWAVALCSHPHPLASLLALRTSSKVSWLSQSALCSCVKNTEEQRSDQALNLEMMYEGFYTERNSVLLLILLNSGRRGGFWVVLDLLLNSVSEAFEKGMVHVSLSRLQKGKECLLCF